jgi:streptogramin lyase
VGVDPIELAIALGSVWVPNLEDETISRIDPATGIVDTIPIGSPVSAIAVDESTGNLRVVIAERLA